MALQLREYSRHLTDQLSGFARIDLEEMNKARLMNRLDNKFVINRVQLEQIIPELSHNFSILEINNSVNHSYTSFYYDTTRYDMYLSHHNKRVNRYKIRQRLYNTSGDSFLEIKFKNNKGITRKTRIETEGEFKSIPYSHYDFIKQNSAYNALMLHRVLENNFDRFTLTNTKRNQRITIDTDLSFWLNNKPLSIPNLVVVEVKSTRDDIDPTIYNLLRQFHIHPTGMSKYSIGLAMLKPDLKQNLFKQKIHTIKKLTHEY